MIQLQFLNKLLDTKNSSLITLNNLTSDYFSNYRKEFNFILNHLREYNSIPDKETFLNVFPDFELINVTENDNYLLEELFKDYKENALVDTFNKVRDLMLAGKSEEALNVYKNSVDKIAISGTALQCVDLLKDTSRYDRYLEKTKNIDKYYISTGFKELDNILGGWDRQEELATIVARTNNGKSWLLLKCATAAIEQNLNVGIYSGEMSADKVGYRIDTLLSHISNGSLTHGNNNVVQDYNKYIAQIKNRYTGSLKVLTPNMIQGPAGVTALRAFIEKENLDILFVDQHSLLEDDRKAKNPVERASNISKDLKNLQVLKQIPIIAVSQLNRTKNEDGSELLDSSMVSQSDRISQDSTCLIGITRDKKDNSLFKIHIIKSRDSVNGKILSYLVDLDKGKFTYIPEEEDEKEENNETENNTSETYMGTDEF